MADLKSIESLVIENVQALAEDFEIEALAKPSADSALYGSGGPLDSMALVNLIADLEDSVSEKYGVSIVLADEKAMSAHNSPYRSVLALSHAIEERISEAEEATT